MSGRIRGTRGTAMMPYVPDITPEAALDPLLTDYLRRELEKIQDTLDGIDQRLTLAREAIVALGVRITALEAKP